ncbi:germination protein YpeB [Paenibacillus septentrionalis]|uniref:Germination protein YpeB n=1 Tax=Paenibacillus septentrionalis TaxID=429342 RepID=A0ABW1V4C5_9BACL
MYRRLSIIMFPIMTILFIGAMYWGYQEHQEKNAVLLKAENGYQRAFGDLTYYVQKLNDELGNTLAVNASSMDYQRKGLANVWRISSEAQHAISQLPLSYLPFADAQNFLSRVSNFAYKTSIRDLGKQPLSNEEFNTLKSLYSSSNEISTQLGDLQNNIMSSSLRWMDVEVALSVNEAETENPVVSGLREVNDHSTKYSDVEWGPAVNSMYIDNTITMLSGGNPISAEEAAKLAAEFIDTDVSNIEIAENGKESDFPTYTATVKDDADGDKKLSITAKGGKLVMYSHYRDVADATLSLEQAEEKAEEFVEQHGFDNMEAVSYDEYYNTGTFTFVHEIEDDVLVYPEKITVKVALDDGEVVGFQATEYASRQRDRQLSKPARTLNEAVAALNPEFKVKKQRMAIIDGEIGEEVLCYEFTGNINNQLYRIYINAETGIEEKIEKMSRNDQAVSS